MTVPARRELVRFAQSQGLSERRALRLSRDRNDEGDQSPKMVSSQARREQVTLACERGVSKRRACELIEIARSGLAYHAVRAERDAPMIEATKRLAAQYPRYGYRGIRVFPRREGHGMSRHRAHRLWRLAGLQLPRRRPRRRVAASPPAAVAGASSSKAGVVTTITFVRIRALRISHRSNSRRVMIPPTWEPSSTYKRSKNP